jgi:segregation and condensation protein B
MSEVDVIPELKQIVGALLFAAKEPVSIAQMKQVFALTAEQQGGITKDFAAVTDELLVEALAHLNQELKSRRVGIHVREVANGYRLVNDAHCGLWLRTLLEKGKGNRLSRPALETLAIIAYRQPVVRSEIEAVRGVAVDQIIRNLLDLQLIRVVGRSDLPGRPWLFGTTQKFLEHFGIKSLDDLPGTDELRRLEAEQLRRKQQEDVEQPNIEEEEPAPTEPEQDDEWDEDGDRLDQQEPDRD